MAKISLHILTLTLLFLLACYSRAETNNATPVPYVDVDCELVNSLKAIFAGQAPPSQEATDPATTYDAGSDARGNTQRIISDPETSCESSIIFPPRWPQLAPCPCTCESGCNSPVCCSQSDALTRIKVELEEIARSLESVPPLKHIPVIVETADYNPVIIYAEASPDMSNNTISREVVEKLGRESEIQFQESKYKTRREYLVMTILLGRDYRAFPRQTFFVIEPNQNYANTSIVIGSNLLKAAGASKLQPEHTEHAVAGLKILVDRPQED
jgi:hypothetical protein